MSIYKEALLSRLAANILGIRLALVSRLVGTLRFTHQCCTIKAALFTGARCSELTQLEVANINIDTASLYISPSKNNKGR